jgi:hypothetical protein
MLLGLRLEEVALIHKTQGLIFIFKLDKYSMRFNSYNLKFGSAGTNFSKLDKSLLSSKAQILFYSI